MKVIAAGFPKTGTKSLNAGLQILGYKNVYDFIENGVYLHDEWQKIFHEGWDVDTFKSMYENVDAVVDVPACYFWEEILKAFPDSKIILTIRDDEEAWCTSMVKQVTVGDDNYAFRMLQYLSPTQRRLLYGCGYGIGTVIFADKRMFEARWYGRKTNRELLKLKYRAHNAYVLQNAPADKLLVYRVNEGWEPLCKFLGVPVPDQPFPHKNVKGAVLKELMETHPAVLKMQREMMVSAGVLCVTAIACGYLLYKTGYRAVMRCCRSLALGFADLFEVD